jgi:molybdopterin-guanine dinucleotide biosynthesis protein A
MAQNTNIENQNEVLIKFLVPRRLKKALQEKAQERNITISAFMRLISSEYVKRTK